MEGEHLAGDPRRRPFADRRAAGEFLAQHLGAYRGVGALVLGIPRGGVVVAAEVALRLDADLDIVVARKVGLPTQPELAIGAVTANGGLCLNEDVIAELGVTRGQLDAAIARERLAASQREQRLRDGRPPAAMEGRQVIVVDDGLATGATMRAAARSVRSRRPARLVLAVPVGARESVELLRHEADEVVCPWQPEPFYAVGLYYAHFAPVEDGEVLQLLAGCHARRAQPISSVSNTP